MKKNEHKILLLINGSYVPRSGAVGASNVVETSERAANKQSNFCC